MIDKKDIKKMIAGHSTEFTLHHMYQELGELIVAVSDLEISLAEFNFDQQYKEALIEEMGDVVIMLEIMKEVYNVSDDRLESEVKNKIKKNLRRVENGKK